MSLGLEHLHGVAESTLPPDVAASLPAQTPGAPWETVIEAVAWAHRAVPDARDLLPAPLRDQVVAEVTVGAFLHYLASPVGTYTEVLASPLVVRPRPFAAHVPFIAVDSVASVHGGRAHWSLPKALAEFDWTGPRRPATATGDGWQVTAAARVLPLRLPTVAWFGLAQVPPSGQPATARVRVTGWVSPARVQVATQGPSLPDWLLTGRHPGIVVTRARQVVGRLRPR